MPHYDRHTGVNDPTIGQSDSVLDDDEDAMDEAAQALREAEVEAVRPTQGTSDTCAARKYEHRRAARFAAKLDVPNRGAITEQDQLIAAIRQRT